MNSPIPPVMSSVCDACPATKEYFIDGLQRFSYNLAKGGTLLAAALIITGIAGAAMWQISEQFTSKGVFGKFFKENDVYVSAGVIAITSLFFNCVVNHKMNIPYPNLSGFVFTVLSIGIYLELLID